MRDVLEWVGGGSLNLAHAMARYWLSILTIQSSFTLHNHPDKSGLLLCATDEGIMRFREIIGRGQPAGEWQSRD